MNKLNKITLWVLGGSLIFIIFIFIYGVVISPIQDIKELNKLGFHSPVAASNGYLVGFGECRIVVTRDGNHWLYKNFVIHDAAQLQAKASSLGLQYCFS